MTSVFALTESRRGTREVLAALVAVLALVVATTPAKAQEASTRTSESSGAEDSTTPEEAESDGTLRPGESLAPGESVTSPNGRYRLGLQHDGNLVLYATAGPTALWDSRTFGESDRRLVMQHDGNLVLYELPIAPFQALWHSRTHGSPGAFLTVGDNGDLTIGLEDGTVLWSTGANVPDVGLSGVKHIVYGRSAHRLWLLEADGSLLDSYPVSGRATSPDPGRYRVFSKSVNAWSFVSGITMKHMVRFARGRSGAAIGFHSIPNNSYGNPIQTDAQLGTFRSAGCVRQRNDKALQLYQWAPIGTPVVVVA